LLIEKREEVRQRPILAPAQCQRGVDLRVRIVLHDPDPSRNLDRRWREPTISEVFSKPMDRPFPSVARRARVLSLWFSWF